MQRILLSGETGTLTGMWQKDRPSASQICSKYLFMGTLGGAIYYGCEILFRGYSHWTMFLLGGIVMAFITWQGECGRWRDPLWLQVVRSMVFITSCEFITGLIVNKFFNWHVWDYSGEYLHLFGQICLPFVLLFGGMSALAVLFCRFLVSVLY